MSKLREFLYISERKLAAMHVASPLNRFELQAETEAEVNVLGAKVRAQASRTSDKELFALLKKYEKKDSPFEHCDVT